MTMARLEGEDTGPAGAASKPALIESNPVMAAGLALAILAFTLAFFADTAEGDAHRPPPAAETPARP